MTHRDSHEGNAVSKTRRDQRFTPLASTETPHPLTQLDIATLAAGVTHHGADAALHGKLLAAGLLREDASTGHFDLTDKAYALLEENGYTFLPKQGWRIDTARAVRLIQPR